MRVPYWLQGALFAPACAILIFVLKVTCPAPNGAGCFADPFLAPLFFPLPFFYTAFGNIHALVYHEPWFVLGYWTLVGLLAGIIADACRSQNPND